MLLLTGTDEIMADKEVPASVVLGRPEFFVRREKLLERGAKGIVDDSAASVTELVASVIGMLL
jgi:hypothetical protein